VGLEQGPLSLVRIIEELFEWKSSGCGSIKSRLTAVEIRCADNATPSIPTNFADMWRSLGRYSLLADESYGVLVLIIKCRKIIALNEGSY
jgi:hypothetical protein